MNDLNNKSALDVGAGRGHVIENVLKSRFVKIEAFDRSKSAYKILKQIRSHG